MAIDDASCVTAAIAAGVTPTAALFRSLGDETRLRIVARLAAGEARVVDLTGELGLAQSTVSKHLACLRGCGLVDAVGATEAPRPASGTVPRVAVA
jgi:ArsR family transcriptional regulator